MNIEKSSNTCLEHACIMSRVLLKHTHAIDTCNVITLALETCSTRQVLLQSDSGTYQTSQILHQNEPGTCLMLQILPWNDPGPVPRRKSYPRTILDPLHVTHPALERFWYLLHVTNRGLERSWYLFKVANPASERSWTCSTSPIPPEDPGTCSTS